MRRQVLKWAIAGACLAMLQGCGFQLRGAAPLPFASAYVEAGVAVLNTTGITSSSYTSHRMTSQIAPLLRNYLAQNQKLAPGKEQAAIVIHLTNEAREKSILTLSGTGKVREYRLMHRVTLSALDGAGKEVLAPALIQLNRDFSYSDEQIMAKEAEEVLLLKEMEQDILRQIVRRLAYVHTQ
jgi:LPS-assembly lipoprotein